MLVDTLILAASRIGGEEGVALACASRDMILDRDSDPRRWPIDELTDLLRSPTKKRDGQVEQLVRRLDYLHQEIDCSEEKEAAGEVGSVSRPRAGICHRDQLRAARNFLRRGNPRPIFPAKEGPKLEGAHDTDISRHRSIEIGCSWIEGGGVVQRASLIRPHPTWAPSPLGSASFRRKTLQVARRDSGAFRRWDSAISGGCWSSVPAAIFAGLSHTELPKAAGSSECLIANHFRS